MLKFSKKDISVNTRPRKLIFWYTLDQAFYFNVSNFQNAAHAQYKDMSLAAKVGLAPPAWPLHCFALTVTQKVTSTQQKQRMQIYIIAALKWLLKLLWAIWMHLNAFLAFLKVLIDLIKVIID